MFLLQVFPHGLLFSWAFEFYDQPMECISKLVSDATARRARRGASRRSPPIADIQISAHLITLPPPIAHISRFLRPQSYALARKVATCSIVTVIVTVIVTGPSSRASTDDTANVVVAALALRCPLAPQPHPYLQPSLPASSGPSDLL